MVLIRTNIYKRKYDSGKVVWVVRWKDRPSGQWKAIPGGQSRSEAMMIESKVRQALLEGKDPAQVTEALPEQFTVGDVIDRFYSHSRFLGGNQDWRVAIQSKLENQIRPALGNKLFDALRQDEIFKFYLQLKAQGLSHATIHKYHMALSILGEAFRDLSCSDDNPIRRCRDFRKRFPVQASTRDINFLTPEELEKIYNEARKSENSLLFPLVKFLANTGLRRSEALDLKWNDIDFKSGFIHIRTSKNGQSRMIPLDIEARDALENLKKASVYVFVNKEGYRYYCDSFLKPLQKAAKAAGIDKRVDLHSLRHSWGSNKIRQGWGLKKVSKILGHSNITITSKIYAHLLDGDLKVSDDHRLNSEIEKKDTGKRDGSKEQEKMAHVLAEAITKALLSSSDGSVLIPQLLDSLAIAETSRNIPNDPTISQKNPILATPVLRADLPTPRGSSSS